MPSQTIVPGSVSTTPVLPFPSVQITPATSGVPRYEGVPDLSDSVLDFSEPVELLRASGAMLKTTAGRLEPASGFGSRTILAHVFPASARTVSSLPEGHTIGGTIEVHSVEELTVADPVARTLGDRIRRFGRLYEVSVAGHRSAGPNGGFRWGVYYAREVREP